MSQQKNFSNRLYLFLAALFIAALVASNLIFLKFFYWDITDSYTFVVSVGILPYPITFLITDIISEIYGRKKANLVVTAGIGASLFSILIVAVASAVPATANSPVNDEIFDKVFGLSSVAVGASMMAYLLAQFVDIRIYHFWKKYTKGKKLWLRNNASTFFSQIVDTAVVLSLLCSFGSIEWSMFENLLINGVLFKILVAFLDTPLLYLSTYFIRKKLGLKFAEEVPEDW